MNRLLFKWTVTNSSDYWNMNCVIDQSCIYLNCLSVRHIDKVSYTSIQLLLLLCILQQ